MNLSNLPNLSMVFQPDGKFSLAPADPRSVFSGRCATVPLAQRDMLVDECPNLRKFNAVASAFAGRPIFGTAVVLPVASPS